MRFLFKPGTYSTCMYPVDDSGGKWWTNLFEHPTITKDKDSMPLAIFGTLVSEPEIDPKTGHPRCIGANVESLYALQLDYDSGTTMEEFKRMFAKYRWSLYTSYGYGYKPGDRFRVVMPLASPLPCYLLENARVKKNLVWHFGDIDVCCFDRGHFQCTPCVRSEESPYVIDRNDGELWGGDRYWSTYKEWKEADDAKFAEQALLAKEKFKEVDTQRLAADLEFELREIPVGAGQRYASVKHLLAKYMHKGLGDAVLGIDCPWDDKKWQRQWPNMVRWASTIC